MDGKRQTKVYAPAELKRLALALQELSGLSFSDLCALGVLQLLAQHQDHLEFGARRDAVRARMMVLFQEILGPLDVGSVKSEQRRAVTVSVGNKK